MKTSFLPTTLVLTNGTKMELDLTEHMAVNLLKELRRTNQYARATCSCYIDNELVVIDMREVAAIMVSGLEDGVWENIQNFDEQPKHISKQTALPQLPPEEYERERYRVECKCGSEYFCNMNTGRVKAHCRDCRATVFADYKADKVIDYLNGVEVVLLTNKYWVEQKPDMPSIQPLTRI